jgi:hypothetical protein
MGEVRRRLRPSRVSGRKAVEQDPTVEQVMEAMDATDERDELLAALITILAKARMMGVTPEELIRHVEDALR